MYSSTHQTAETYPEALVDRTHVHDAQIEQQTNDIDNTETRAFLQKQFWPLTLTTLQYGLLFLF